MKFNRKSVTVITDNGQRWNISPHLLSPIKDAQTGTVVDIKHKKTSQCTSAPAAPAGSRM
ncbi:hypothetical protein [Pseudomonas khavaziana]|uniref:hypothetical protein n=1 Tax=Pseudomonas khavaziana TaxID=2842351 RepID=UPI001C3D505A|nr:hypothetical protein [Pseudomonas khavaziana]MBV4481737.1 hypothetical protein [Pseudomonas khavaziana]